MKFVALTGGLGNQMFIYAFCEELRMRGFSANLFIQHKTNLSKYGHQGYELEKFFSIQPYSNKKSQLFSFLLMLYSQSIRIFPAKYRNKLFKIVGLHVRSVDENFIYYPEIFLEKSKNELFRGTWQSELYFKSAVENVRNAFTFKDNLINALTKELSFCMQKEISVSVHIRRGDYLSAHYVNGFAGICTVEYYEDAVKIIKEKYSDAKFYVFTDDPQWVNKNIKIENAQNVQYNTGKDSWQDMYLMSQCKHNIIANSSFSWWGAWLNNNPDKIVIAPKTWWNGFLKDDVVPENWIRI